MTQDNEGTLDCVFPDGSMENLAAPFIRWKRGDETIILDGRFTAPLLRSIADQMES